ncbi:UPF0769 protein C21orf59 [Selaginella moellendorffii]|uniref:UPF0769 protein C21orf59 n=1 Tax=Selaginella moellendorffii TaxID=88036 RepID=UPI000D1C96FF|nr:UPF0769 protein C21orf59 [Selaginella moellendorffii]|eukprot:XP_024539409.1 UPF0769 protein C21orf59 [Selaginella moellendorffii]
MVLLHFKQGDDRQFLFEAPGAECVDAIVRDVVAVNNLQLRILHLVQECGQLLEYGPIKSKEEQEQDEEEEDEGNSTGASSSSSRKERGPFYKKDPSGRRTGEETSVSKGLPRHDPVQQQLTGTFEGKELMRDKRLADYVGKNDKTKTLKENTDDSYTNSEWANPQALKAHFHGTSNIRFR